MFLPYPRHAFGVLTHSDRTISFSQYWQALGEILVAHQMYELRDWAGTSGCKPLVKILDFKTGADVQAFMDHLPEGLYSPWAVRELLEHINEGSELQKYDIAEALESISGQAVAAGFYHLGSLYAELGQSGDVSTARQARLAAEHMCDIEPQGLCRGMKSEVLCYQAPDGSWHPTTFAKVLAEDKPRFWTNVLAKHWSRTPPAVQDALWACAHELLPLLDNNGQAAIAPLITEGSKA